MKPSRRYWTDLPWMPRDIRAMIALVFSIIGSGVMCIFAAWLVWIMWKGGWHADTQLERIKWLGSGMMVLLGGMFVVVASLGMAINRRSFRGKLGLLELDASGGPEETQVTTTTTVTASSAPAVVTETPAVESTEQPAENITV